MNEKPATDESLDELRKQINAATLREAIEAERKRDRETQQEHKGRTWRSLKTLAGWAAFTALMGSVLWDMADRLVTSIGRK